MTARRRLMDYRPGRLGQSTLLGTAGLGTRAVIQAAYLLIVSRWLGAEGYGLFAGSVALVILAAPLANWGSASLLTRYIAQDRGSSRAMWATVLVQTGLVGSMLALITLASASLLLQHRLPLTPLLLLALSELLLLPTAHAATSQCYALEHGLAAATVMCLVPLGRSLTMLSFILIGLAGTPEHAAFAHFMGSLLGLMGAAAIVTMIDGLPAWRSRLRLRDAIQQGSAYAVGNVAGASYQEVDKVLMLQTLGVAILGPYTVAFRVASIFLMPVSALVSASLPRLMAHARSTGGARTFRAVLLSGIGYGILAGATILLVAPLIPRIFGDDYTLASHYLVLLAPWPVLFSLRFCMAAHLTAKSHQGLRNCAEIIGLGVIVTLNLLLLPRMGAEGAVLALLTTEMLVTVMMVLISRQKNRARGGVSKHE